jgi:2-alkyl-3-oxoalkanoate reductase
MPESTTPTRVGLIGCGRIAAVHLRHLRALPDVRVVGVCDVDGARARGFAADAGIEHGFADPTELFRFGVDAVHVLTPPTTHADTAITALEHGVHVLVEKPMATTGAEARRMQAAAEAAGRILCVDHNRLFDPVILVARRMVEAGELGNLLSVEAYQGVNVQEGGPAAAPLAMWLNLAPHPLYLLRAFMGDITAWHVVARPVGEMRAVLQGTRALGTLCFSPGASPYLNALALYGTKATLHIDLNTMTMLHRRVRRLPSMLAKAALNVDQAMQLVASTARTTAQVATRRMGTYPGIGQLARRFHDAVRGTGEVPVTVADGVAIVDLLEGLWSATHGVTGTAPVRRVPSGRPRRAGGRVVLVTGASGFLGRHVAAALRDQGHHVRAMVRFAGLAEDLDGVEEVTATLGDDATIAAAVAGAEVVVHCAARVARGGKRADFFRDNVTGTTHLLTAARAAGVERFVHVSSIGIYGVPTGKGPVLEAEGYDPHPDRRGAYTWSKLEADRAALEFARQTGLRVVVIRPGILVGPDGPAFTARLSLGQFGSRLLIVGRGRTRLPLCHVDDAAHAVALAVSAAEARGAYNVVDETLTQDEWLEQRAARGAVGRPLYVPPLLAAVPAAGLELVARLGRRSAPALSRYKIRRATEDVRYDTTRARADLGWRAEIGVRAIGAGVARPASVIDLAPAGTSTALAQEGTS